jgi:hypothetical protein
LWVIFALLDPDPDSDPQTRLNTDPIRIHNPVLNLKIQNICFAWVGTGTVPVYRKMFAYNGKDILKLENTRVKKAVPGTYIM